MCIMGMCMFRERRRDRPDWVYEAVDDDRTLTLFLPGLSSAWGPLGRVGCRLKEFGLLLGECDTDTICTWERHSELVFV